MARVAEKCRGDWRRRWSDRIGFCAFQVPARLVPSRPLLIATVCLRTTQHGAPDVVWCWHARKIRESESGGWRGERGESYGGFGLVRWQQQTCSAVPQIPSIRRTPEEPTDCSEAMEPVRYKYNYQKTEPFGGGLLTVDDWDLITKRQLLSGWRTRQPGAPKVKRPQINGG